MKKYLIMMAIAIASLSASAQKNNQIDTLQVKTTPQMHCVNCENKIKKNIPVLAKDASKLYHASFPD